MKGHKFARICRHIGIFYCIGCGVVRMSGINKWCDRDSED